jgi:hypothetical protein
VNVAFGGLEDNLVLFFCYCGLGDCQTLVSSLTLVYNVSDD